MKFKKLVSLSLTMIMSAGILVGCGDKEGFIEKLLYLMDDKDALNKISKESIKRAKDFSIENISNEWMKIINN